MRGLSKKTLVRQKLLSVLGFNPEDFWLWSDKLSNLKGRAKYEGKTCSLTFEDYISLAKEANILDPNLIGLKKDDFCMGRIGDQGGYELGNCRFITMAQNQAERIANGGSISQSAKLTGRTKINHKGVASAAEKNGRAFKVCSPEGLVYEGNNLTEFSQNMGLAPTSMYYVCQNPGRSRKGWTGMYIKENNVN